MDTDGTGQLGQTGDGSLHLAACGHDEVTELVDNQHDVRQITVAVGGGELALAELGVVLLDVAHLRQLQQVVAGIHLRTQRVERVDDLLHIGDDGVVGTGQHGQIVPLDNRI